MPRRRTMTEMIGCHISRADYEVLKAELKLRRLTVADYLRDAAVKPLVAQLMGEGRVDGQESRAE